MEYTYKPHSVIVTSSSPEEEIGWTTTDSCNTNFLLEKRWSTVRSLKHISNSSSGDIRERTKTLICTDFRIDQLPEDLSGIKLVINAQRNGRIVDEIIQLTYQSSPIGKNNFVYVTDIEGHLTITNETTYGASNDLWDAPLTHNILRDNSFGVILKFQSHPYYPHNVGIMIDSVFLTVY